MERRTLIAMMPDYEMMGVAGKCVGIAASRPYNENKSEQNR
jgi:hypothetical protein